MNDMFGKMFLATIPLSITCIFFWVCFVYQNPNLFSEAISSLTPEWNLTVISIFGGMLISTSICTVFSIFASMLKYFIERIQHEERGQKRNWQPVPESSQKSNEYSQKSKDAYAKKLQEYDAQIRERCKLEKPF